MTNSAFRVLIAGGGVAGLEAALALRAAGGDELDIELIAPDTRFVYRPLSVRDAFGPRATRAYDLAPLLADSRVRLVHGQVAIVEPDARFVRLESGVDLPYDALILATGADRAPAVPGAATFAGPSDAPALKSVVDSLCGGALRRALFVVPPGLTWSLPAYELALETATRVRAAGSASEIALVTPEPAPLDAFGDVASRAVRRELEDRGAEVFTGSYADAFSRGQLRLDLQGSVHADAVWTTSRLVPRVPTGIPRDHNGCVPIDDRCAVRGFVDVFAAGDVTDFPVNQGGVAAQHADTAAHAIAAIAGLAPEPAIEPPVLRAILITGGEPLYLRYENGVSEAAHEPLWWPPHKIFGHHLASLLAGLEHLGTPA